MTPPSEFPSADGLWTGLRLAPGAAPGGGFEEFVFARLARGAHAGDDAAAGACHFLVAGAVQTHGEFVGALAAIDQVGVAIDQARRGQHALAVMARQGRICGRQGLLRPHPGHAALLHHDAGILPVTHGLAGLEHVRRQAQVLPAAVGRRGWSECASGCRSGCVGLCHGGDSLDVVGRQQACSSTCTSRA